MLFKKNHQFSDIHIKSNKNITFSVFLNAVSGIVAQTLDRSRVYKMPVPNVSVWTFIPLFFHQDGNTEADS